MSGDEGSAVGPARLVCDWALADLPLERTIGRTDPDNVASRRVLEHLGFDLVGPDGDQIIYERRSLDGQRASEEERCASATGTLRWSKLSLAVHRLFLQRRRFRLLKHGRTRRLSPTNVKAKSGLGVEYGAEGCHRTSDHWAKCPPTT